MAKNPLPYDDDSLMFGPYVLTAGNITRLVSCEPGAYALTKSTASKGPTVRYVGRSDVNVAGRLYDHLDEGYTAFYFKLALDELDAFEMECEEFHRYGKATRLDNVIHPARPAGYRGPACSKLGCRGESY